MIHTDAIINRRRKTSLTKYLPLTLFVRVQKGYSRSACERELGTEQKLQYSDSLLLWPSTLCLSRSPDAQPEALGSTLLGAGFLYCILSASSLDPNSIRAPEGPFGRVWLSLPHFVLSISNSTATGTQLNCNRNSTVRLLSWLTYIIVQRPLDRILDLWNRMFNRHQA